MRAIVLAASFVAGTPALARAEWTVAAYLGQAHTLGAPLVLSQPSLRTELEIVPVEYRSASFTPPLYYGYRFGYFFSRAGYLGVEGEFVHVKAYGDTSRVVTVRGRRAGIPIDRSVRMSEVVERFSISHGLNFVLVNAVVRYPLGRRDRHERARVHVLGRFGAGPTVPHPESTINGASREGYEGGALGLQWAGGAEARLGRGVFALAEYKFTRSRQSVSVADGEARALMRTHHVVVGLAYHF